MNKLFKKALAIMLTVTVASTTVNLNALAHGNELSVSGGDAEEVVIQDGWDGVTTQDVYEGDGFKVMFTLTAHWDGGYNANVRIENTGVNVIENWYLDFDYPSAISNVWNAETVSVENGRYRVKNAGWNQDILVGQFVEFGVSANVDFDGFPINYNLLGENIGHKDEDYTIDYHLDSDWGTGYTGTISITNNTVEIIEDWSLSFDFERSISSIWNATIEYKDGTRYTVKNAGYNSNIKPGETITFGFSGSEGNEQDSPFNYQLFSYSPSLNILSISEAGLIWQDGYYKLASTFEGFCGELDRAEEVTSFTVSIYDKNQILIYSSDIEPKKNWLACDFAMIYGINTIAFEAQIGNLSDSKVITIDCEGNINFEKLELDENDDDMDGLVNYLEYYFGTDSSIADTDHDGLNDYLELVVLGYDPLNKDTDSDGILDGDEDEDLDGISNIDESVLGSNPLDNDSDNDRLQDKQEIDFGTSPILEDTDGNGISDYEEYLLREMHAEYNDETGMYTATFSADQMCINYDEAVIPTVILTADAEGITSFEIERVESDYILNPYMEGYIGAAYEFHTEGEMQGAELTFTYDESLIGKSIIDSEDFCPTIYYFNTEDQTLTEVENQHWEGNAVSAVLPHFSTYMLINKADLERLWAETIDTEEGTSLTAGSHVVFVIDKSGSMTSNDKNHIRTALIRGFCEKMGPVDKVGLIGFSNSAIKYTEELLQDNTKIEAAIDSFDRERDNGNTYMNTAVAQAVFMLENDPDESDNTQKIIFCLTDGTTADKLSPSYLQDLKERNITIYTVGMGSVNETYLRTVAGLTGGKYFYAKTSADLSEVFISFEDTINEYDSNRDKLGDEITKLICQGRITTITGTRLFCSQRDELGWEKIYQKILESDDFDNDGLKNGEEIEIYYIGSKPYIRMRSNPEYINSDFDMYSDYEETRVYYSDPLRADYCINSDDYQYVNAYKNFESGLSFEAYLDRSDFAIVSEYLFDVIICGGEANANKIARQELLDLFVSYANENIDELEGAAYVNVGNAYLRGIVDIIPGLGAEVDKLAVKLKINELESQILSLRKVPYSKAIKKGIKQEEKALQAALKGHVDSAQRFSKYGAFAGFALTGIACGLQSYEEFKQYNAAVEIVRSYSDILDRLSYCGDGNIELAAQTILRDMQSIKGKYQTGGLDLVNNIISYGSLATSSYLLTSGLGPAGLVLDLVWLGSDLVVGNALDNKIRNFISVECINGVSMATSRELVGAKYKSGANGQVIIITSGDVKASLSRRMFKIDIFAKKWVETRYLEYLQKDRLFMDDDFFLYHSADTENIVRSNIQVLSNMYSTY